jgi:hypothetical protein
MSSSDYKILFNSLDKLKGQIPNYSLVKNTFTQLRKLRANISKAREKMNSAPDFHPVGIAYIGSGPVTKSEWRSYITKLQKVMVKQREYRPAMQGFLDLIATGTGQKKSDHVTLAQRLLRR